jgi:hypothetical protein
MRKMELAFAFPKFAEDEFISKAVQVEIKAALAKSRMRLFTAIRVRVTRFPGPMERITMPRPQC